MTPPKRGKPGMTVAELIEELRKLPQDAHVTMTDYGYAAHYVFDYVGEVHISSDDEPNAGDL